MANRFLAVSGCRQVPQQGGCKQHTSQWGWNTGEGRSQSWRKKSLILKIIGELILVNPGQAWSQDLWRPVALHVLRPRIEGRRENTAWLSCGKRPKSPAWMNFPIWLTQQYQKASVAGQTSKSHKAAKRAASLIYFYLIYTRNSHCNLAGCFPSSSIMLFLQLL